MVRRNGSHVFAVEGSAIQNFVQPKIGNVTGVKKRPYESLDLGFISRIQSFNDKSLQVGINVESHLINFEIDSGACKSVIHLTDYLTYLTHLELLPVRYKLKVVAGQKIDIVREIDVKVVLKLYSILN